MAARTRSGRALARLDSGGGHEDGTWDFHADHAAFPVGGRKRSVGSGAM